MRPQSLNLLKRLLSAVRRHPITALGLLSVLMGLVFFAIALVRGDISRAVLFEIRLLYPDWSILILLPFLLWALFAKQAKEEQVPHAVPERQEQPAPSIETPPIPAPPVPQASGQRQPARAGVRFQPLPEFIAEACVSCGRRVDAGTSYCPHCAKAHQ